MRQVNFRVTKIRSELATMYSYWYSIGIFVGGRYILWDHSPPFDHYLNVILTLFCGSLDRLRMWNHKHVRH